MAIHVCIMLDILYKGFSHLLHQSLTSSVNNANRILIRAFQSYENWHSERWGDFPQLHSASGEISQVQDSDLKTLGAGPLQFIRLLLFSFQPHVSHCRYPHFTFNQIQIISMKVNPHAFRLSNRFFQGSRASLLPLSHWKYDKEARWVSVLWSKLTLE